MWNKGIAGFICGMLFVIFAPSAATLFFLEHTALFIALTIVIGLSGWAVIMTWCFAADSGRQAWRRGGTVAITSLICYAGAFFTVGLPQ